MSDMMKGRGTGKILLLLCLLAGGTLAGSRLSLQDLKSFLPSSVVNFAQVISPSPAPTPTPVQRPKPRISAGGSSRSANVKFSAPRPSSTTKNLLPAKPPKKVPLPPLQKPRPPIQVVPGDSPKQQSLPRLLLSTFYQKRGSPPLQGSPSGKLVPVSRAQDTAIGKKPSPETEKASQVSTTQELFLRRLENLLLFFLFRISK